MVNERGTPWFGEDRYIYIPGTRPSFENMLIFEPRRSNYGTRTVR